MSVSPLPVRRPLRLLVSLAGVAAVMGIVSVGSPLLVLAGTAGVLFVAVTLESLAAGLAMFTVLIFLERIPTISSAGLTFTKLAGGVLAAAWLFALMKPNSNLPLLARRLPFLAYAALVLLCWTFASMLWAPDPGTAGLTALRFSQGVLLIFIVFSAVRERRHLTWIVYAFLAGAVLSASVGLTGVTHADRADIYASGRLTGGIGDPNELAAILVPALGFALFLLVTKKGLVLRSVLFGAAFICTLALFRTESRGGLVGLAVMLLASVVLSGPVRARALTMVLAVSGLSLAYFTLIAPPQALARVTALGAGGGSGRTDIWAVARRRGPKPSAGRSRRGQLPHGRALVRVPKPQSAAVRPYRGHAAGGAQHVPAHPRRTRSGRLHPVRRSHHRCVLGGVSGGRSARPYRRPGDGDPRARNHHRNNRHAGGVLLPVRPVREATSAPAWAPGNARDTRPGTRSRKERQMTIGAGGRARTGIQRGRPLVLCYHAVSETWADPLAVRPAVLERQVRSLLRRGYRPVPAAETLSGRGRLLHVTFDDAYRSVAAAVPLLARLGVPCTVFVCTDYAQQGRPLDIPELAAVAETHPDELATMGWDQLRGLVDRKVAIGSHTLTHAHLTEVSDSELDHELRSSRKRLEDELGVPCRLLAYPYGEHDARVRHAARMAGYEAAFALPGPEGPIDVYQIPRVGLWRKDGVFRATLKTTEPGRRLAARVLRSSGLRRGRPRPGVPARARSIEAPEPPTGDDGARRRPARPPWPSG